MNLPFAKNIKNPDTAAVIKIYFSIFILIVTEIVSTVCLLFTLKFALLLVKGAISNLLWNHICIFLLTFIFIIGMYAPFFLFKRYLAAQDNRNFQILLMAKKPFFVMISSVLVLSLLFYLLESSFPFGEEENIFAYFLSTLLNFLPVFISGLLFNSVLVKFLLFDPMKVYQEYFEKEFSGSPLTADKSAS